ncbi:MAG: 16S rRNA (cytidine(1402)-2'-O)-methyltransferase [Patescibacteria group bacterium]
MPGILYFVATPIGNLKDMTVRAKEILDACSLVACEDTRVTGKLLKAYGISKPLVSLHEHSDAAKLKEIVKKIEAGANVAYASDAGTPGVNDPGGKLAALAFDVGIKIEPIPGASALTAAISVCAFPMDEFAYHGFVPHKKGRETLFKLIAASSAPSVFFESTHRIEKTLEALSKVLDPQRLIFVGRELTKLHETLYRGTCSEVLDRLRQTSQKGEFVVIVGPEVKR